MTDPFPPVEELEPRAAVDEIRRLLAKNDPGEALRILNRLRPADRADAFLELDSAARAMLLPSMDVGLTAELLEELTDADAASVAETLADDILADVLDVMDPDEAADLLGDIPAIRAAQALAEMEDPEDVIPLLGHPDETAGGLMTTAFIALRRRTTAAQAIEFLRQVGPDVETPYYIYVVDRNRRLIGVVGLRDLVIAAPDMVVEEFLDKDVIYVTAGTDQEDAARIIDRYDLAALPVVDENGILLGVITHDDVIDVLKEEATEDVLNLGGIEAGPISDRPYWSLRVTEIVRSRFIWLLVLFVAQTLTTTVLRHFQNELQAAISLSFFIPLLIGTGGNAGSQTVATVIRALALDEIHWSDTLRVALREFRTGALLGVLLGIVAFFWVLLTGVQGELATIVAIAVFAICIWANIVGALVPILASALGIDPTVMSAPLISTLVDATGLLIYFTVAVMVLQRL